MSVILPSSDSRHLAWGLFEQLGVMAKVSIQYLVTSTWETLPCVDYNKGRIPSCWPWWSCLHSALAGRRSIISLALKAVLANRSGVEAECHLSVYEEASEQLRGLGYGNRREVHLFQLGWWQLSGAIVGKQPEGDRFYRDPLRTWGLGIESSCLLISYT